ncbi:MAG: hypothetical protein R3Y08_03850 [Rikenellaceae bacterium]
MRHLLIVSNDPLQRAIVSMTLESQEHHIVAINTSQCVVEACRAHSIDTIIFLTLSPYFTSMNIVDELSRMLSNPPSIYVITQSHSAAVVLMLLECGVDQYLTFPLNLYRLRRKIFGEETTAISQC